MNSTGLVGSQACTGAGTLVAASTASAALALTIPEMTNRNIMSSSRFLA
jgi:hypothetical protein